jgi:ABC-type branched-subunit amino acid transport system substrate-binding protein
MKRNKAIMAAVAGVIALSACASNGSNGSRPSGDFTGKPVVVYSIAPVRTQIVDFYQIPAGVMAAARAINASGGLAGHEVRVKFCNDTDATAEINCARAAVKDDALAVVGGIFIFNPDASEKILRDAQIPNIGGEFYTNSEYANPNNFPMAPLAVGYAGCYALSDLFGEEQSTFGQAHGSNPQSTAIAATMEEAATRWPVRQVQVSVPDTTTDFSAAVQRLENAEADHILLSVNQVANPQIIGTATTQGANFSSFCNINLGFNNEDLAGFEDTIPPVYVTAATPALPDAGKSPLYRQFVNEMKEEENAGNADASLTGGSPGHAINSWLATQALKAAVENVQGDLTGASVLSALSKTTLDTQGMTADPIDFSKPQPLLGFQRMFNTSMFLWKWDPTTASWVTASSNPVDLAEFLK